MRMALSYLSLVQSQTIAIRDDNMSLERGGRRKEGKVWQSIKIYVLALFKNVIGFTAKNYQIVNVQLT